MSHRRSRRPPLPTPESHGQVRCRSRCFLARSGSRHWVSAGSSVAGARTTGLNGDDPRSDDVVSHQCHSRMQRILVPANLILLVQVARDQTVHAAASKPLMPLYELPKTTDPKRDLKLHQTHSISLANHQRVESRRSSRCIVLQVIVESEGIPPHSSTSSSAISALP